MTKEKADTIDVNKELEELPALISYQEQLMENVILEIAEAKNEKNKKVAETIMKYEKSPFMVQKAMIKKAQADEETKILVLKKKMSEISVEFNRLRNRFQSIRKLASLRIEEMKHGLEYRKEVDN
jgi:ribosome biogenesis protein Nip4